MRQKPLLHHAKTLNAPAAAHPFPKVVQHGGGIDDGTASVPAGDGNVRNIRVGGHKSEQHVGQPADKRDRVFVQRPCKEGQHVAVGGQQAADIGHPQIQIVHAVCVGKAAVHGVAMVFFIQQPAYVLIGGQTERRKGKGQQDDDPHELCPNTVPAHTHPPFARLSVLNEASHKRKGMICFIIT